MALSPSRVTIHAVQFVGTNVEMTWTVDPTDLDDATPEAVLRELDALLASKLRIHAADPTGTLDGRPRFSVMGSPLERLWHKIGPPMTLTTIKHASATLDLSQQNLVRQGQGLMRTYGDADPGTPWTPWDAGKLLGLLLATPTLHAHGPVRVFDVVVEDGAFPQAILPTFEADQAAAGGVPVALPSGLRDALA